MNFIKEVVGTINNREINVVTFTNDNNFTISFYTFGGYINSVLIPYRDDYSKFEDVILGYENLEDCKSASSYFNAIIGRVGNRMVTCHHLVFLKNLFPKHASSLLGF